MSSATDHSASQELTRWEKAARTKAANAAKRKAAAEAAMAGGPPPPANTMSTSPAVSAGRVTRTTRLSAQQDQDKKAGDSLNTPNPGSGKSSSTSRKRLPPTPVKESGKAKIAKLSKIKENINAEKGTTQTVKPQGSGKRAQPKDQGNEAQNMEIDSDKGTDVIKIPTTRNDQTQSRSHLAPSIDITMLDLSGGGKSDAESSIDSSEERTIALDEADGEEVSGSDNELEQLARNPVALRKAFDKERPSWNRDRTHGTDAIKQTSANDPESLSDVLDPDMTIRPLHDRPESRASVASTTASLILDHLDLSNADDEQLEDEAVAQMNAVEAGQAIKPRPLNKTVVVVTEKKQTRSKREEKFKNETAAWNSNDGGDGKHVVTSSQKTSKTAEVKLRSETTVKHQNADWDASTDLVYERKGSNRINLKAQQTHIREIISKTIGTLLRDIIVFDAFPEGTRGADDLQGHAAHAAKQAAAELGYDMVATRLVHDHKYRDSFTRIPKDRISGFRTKSKAILQTVLASLGLKRFTLPIDWETVKNKRLYIFPCNNNGKPDINKPYESPKIISILTVLFFRGSAASNIKFEPSLPEYGGKKCVSNAMVAFAAAASYACFKVIYEPGTSLEISISIRDVYRNHFRLLHDLESEYPAHHGKLMSKLYDAANNGIDTGIEHDSEVTLKDIIDTTGMDE